MKLKDPFAGLEGFPQLTGEQVAVSQDSFARQAIEAADLVYPLSQVTAAVEPKVVVVKSREPFVGLTGFPQLIGEQVTVSHV